MKTQFDLTRIERASRSYGFESSSWSWSLGWCTRYLARDSKCVYVHERRSYTSEKVKLSMKHWSIS